MAARAMTQALPAMEVPLFESPTLPPDQPDNVSLWRAYEAMRAAPNGESAEALRALRVRRTSWSDNGENAMRRMIDKALDLWPNVELTGRPLGG